MMKSLRYFALCALLILNAASVGMQARAADKPIEAKDLIGIWQDDNGKTFEIQDKGGVLQLQTKLKDWVTVQFGSVRDGQVTFERKPTASELSNLTPDPGKSPPNSAIVGIALSDQDVMQYFDGAAARDPNDRYTLLMNVVLTGDHLVYSNPDNKLLSVDHPKTQPDRYHKKLGFVVITPSNLDNSNVDPRDIGGMDFGSEQTGITRVRHLTLKNGGEGILHVSGVISNGTFYTESKDDKCTLRALKPGETCDFTVDFSPSSIGEKTGEATVYDDSPDSPEMISLKGTGTEEFVSPSQAESREGGVGLDPHKCDNALRQIFTVGYTVGWAPLNYAPVTVAGQMLEAHVASTDMVHDEAGHKYHETSDLDMFIYPEQGNRKYLQPGNFAIGEDFTPSEKGRMTIESETYLDDQHPGLPSWVWPTTGDKVKATGVHIFDCGHSFKGSYRAEVHPVEFIATYRNAALTTGATTGGLGSFDPHDGAAATRVDAWASNYGGPTLGVQSLQYDTEWFKSPIGSYEFDVLAPPKPTPTAMLAPPVVDSHGMGSANCENIATLNGRGYRFRITPGGAAGRAFGGCTIYVEWQDVKRPDTVKAKTHTYTVTIENLHVLNPLVGEDWGLYASINENQTMSLLTGAKNALTQTFREVKKGQVISVNHSIPVTVIDGQALHVEFRVTSWLFGPTKKLHGYSIFGDWGVSQFAGTTGVMPDPGAAIAGARHESGSAKLPNNIGDDELDGDCKTPSPCYDITYSIH